VGVLALAPAEVRLAGVLVYGAIFALGESAYSCSYHPWLISKVPERELTRANALSNSMTGIGVFFGRSIGVILIGTGSATTVWLLLALMCATVGLSTVPLGRPRARRGPSPDGRPVQLPAPPQAGTSEHVEYK